MTTKTKKIIALVVLFLVVAIPTVEAARTSNFWKTVGNRLQTTKSTGYDILINGLNKYLNFGTFSGETGYGFRDNAGQMEIKSSGGAWSGIDSVADRAWVINPSGNLTSTTTPMTIEMSSFIASSTTATSTIAGNLQVDGNLEIGVVGYSYTAFRAPELHATSTIATSTFAGGLTVDTDKFVVDPDGGRVGIGTDSPSDNLEIVDDTASLKIDGNNHAYITLDRGADSRVGAIRFSTADTIGHKIGYFVNSDNLKITNIGETANWFVVDTSGNVGIGTDSPDRKLHIQVSDASLAPQSSWSQLILEENDDVRMELMTPVDKRAGIIFSDGVLRGGIEYDHAVATERLFLTSGGTEAVTILADGNVGIGTDSPAVDMEIARSGSTNHTRLRLDAAGTDTVKGFQFAEDGTVLSIIQQRGTNISGPNELQLATLFADGFIGFSTGSDVEAMRIDSSGNVGIGTTSPAYELTIAGEMQISDASPKLYIFETDNPSSNWNLWGTGGDLHFRESTETASLVLESGGNVGIGTTTPWGKLAVTNTGNGPSFIVEDSTSPDTTPFIVDSTGNVGIRKAVPTTSLHIKGNTGIYLERSAGNYGLSLSADGSGSYIEATANDLQISTGSTPAERMRITQAGNVGIGTTDPGAKLHIEVPDSQVITGDALTITTDADIYPTMQTYIYSHDNVALSFDSYFDSAWYSGDAGSNFQIYKYNDLLQFRYDNGIPPGSALTWNTGMVIDTSGKVGIGTTTPYAKLSVVGDSATAPLVNMATSTDVSVFKIDSDGVITEKYGIYCQIGTHDAMAPQTIPTGVTYTKLLSLASTTPATLRTKYCDTDTDNSRIVITNPGDYRVSGSFSFSGDNNVTFRGVPFVDGIEQDLLHWKRKISTNDSGSASFTGFVTATSTTEVDVRLRHDSGGGVDIVIDYANLNVEFIGN